MTNIYNLFKFLEEKENERIPFELRLIYAPETFTSEDLHIKRNLSFRHGKQIKHLPDNLTVDGNVNLSNTNIKNLPNNLTVNGTLYFHNTEIKHLPDDLTVERLALTDTLIKTIPSTIKALKIDISKAEHITPSGIPKNLRRLIEWSGGNFTDFEKYETMPPIKIPGVSKPIKGYEVKLNTLEDIPGLELIGKDAPEFLHLLKTSPVKEFTCYKVFEPGYSIVVIRIHLNIKLLELPTPLNYTYEVLYPSLGELKYKSKKMKLSTFERDLSVRGLDVALGRLVPGYATVGIPQHLKDKNGKLLKLSQIVDKEQKPVSIALGNKQRGGRGIKGQYKDYLLAFSGEAQNNLIVLANKLNIKWGDFIAYRFNGDGDVNYVVKGEGQNGEVYYLNRYGSGAGGTSKLYNKEFKEIKGTSAY